MRTTVLSVSVVFVSWMATAGSATAVPTYCSAIGGNTDGLALSDVTFGGGYADDCYGTVSVQHGNNDSVDKMNEFGLWGGGWEQGVSDSGANGTLTNYLGFNWTLSSPNTGTSGSWMLTIADAPPAGGFVLPFTVDIIAVVKPGNQWAGYFFDNETFGTLDTYGGSYQFDFTTNSLSHLSLYFRQQPNPPPPGDVPVPEPASLFMLGTGLVGLAAGARKGLFRTAR